MALQGSPSTSEVAPHIRNDSISSNRVVVIMTMDTHSELALGRNISDIHSVSSLSDQY
jgi:hypothetical protein